MSREHRIVAFEASALGEWDAFVQRSRNGTFLFERGYMDYHADRFVDESLLVRDNKGRIECLLPANRDGRCVTSHGGLTYGGFVVDDRMRTATLMEVFEDVSAHFAARGIREWLYKPVPHIYHRRAAEEDLYALFRLGARLVRRDVGACVRPGQVDRFSERVRSPLRKAEAAGLVFSEAQDLKEFWPLLRANLKDRHHASPTHSLEEMELLRARFPEEIRVYEVRMGETLVAGAILYVTPCVAHVQYAAANDEGRRLGAPTYLLVQLVTRELRESPWLDYGISTEADGRVLNLGLQSFKEGCGLSALVSDCYRVDLL